MSHHNWHKVPLLEALECIQPDDDVSSECPGCGLKVSFDMIEDVFDVAGFSGTFADAADIIALEGKQIWMQAPEPIFTHASQLAGSIHVWLESLDREPAVREQAAWPIYREILAGEWLLGRMPPLPDWLAQALKALEAKDAGHF